MKITLCGSTKFMTAFGDWNVILTKGGHVVYSVCQSSHGLKVPNEEEKRRFDLIHLQKIAESDAIVVLNVDGYYGDSTLRELEWARMLRKDIYWLENARPKFMGPTVFQLYNLFEDKPIASIPEALPYTEEGRRATAGVQEAELEG